MIPAAILRSPHAAARIKEIRTAEARKIPGVIAVWTFSDLADVLKPIPQVAPHPSLRPRTPFPLVKDIVHHQGEPVALWPPKPALFATMPCALSRSAMNQCL